jgi:hypothetical protein
MLLFFWYDQDFHTSNNLHLKGRYYQDLIGLQVTDSGVSLIPQSNTYYPQFMEYDSSPKAHINHQLAVTSLLTYISKFKNLPGFDLDKSN